MSSDIPRELASLEIRIIFNYGSRPWREAVRSGRKLPEIYMTVAKSLTVNSVYRAVSRGSCKKKLATQCLEVPRDVLEFKVYLSPTKHILFTVYDEPYERPDQPIWTTEMLRDYVQLAESGQCEYPYISIWLGEEAYDEL